MMLQTALNNPIIIFIIGGVILLSIFVIWLVKHPAKNSSTKISKLSKADIATELITADGEKIIKSATPNVLLFDVKKRIFGLRQLLNPVEGKNYGSPKHHYNYTVVWLQLTADNHLEAVAVPSLMDHSPSEVARAINQKEKVRGTFRDRNNDTNKPIMWWLIFLAGFALLMLYAAIQG